MRLEMRVGPRAAPKTGGQPYAQHSAPSFGLQPSRIPRYASCDAHRRNEAPRPEPFGQASTNANVGLLERASKVLVSVMAAVFVTSAIPGASSAEIAYTAEAARTQDNLEEYFQWRGDTEWATDCEECSKRLVLLERFWQVVANNYYGENFSETAWAKQLLDTVKREGPLRTDADLNRAARSLLRPAHSTTATTDVPSAPGVSFDPYTSWLAPTEFRAAVRETSRAEASYYDRARQGPGLVLGAVSPLGGREVLMVTAGSSAESAGIKMGDRVLDIEGMPAASVSARIASEMLRGPLGSAVTLSVTKGEHAGKSTATEGATPKAAEVVVLDRRRLSQPAVRSVAVDVPSGGWVSYVRMHYFSQSLAGKLRAAVAEAEASERPPVGYVIDVRNNPGGDFEEAVVASSMFLDCDGAGQCDVVKTVSRGGEAEATHWTVEKAREMAGTAAPITSRPIVVLTDNGTASSGEIFAGVLRDQGRAVIMGDRTYGKGLIQYYFPVGGGGAGAKVTVAKYILPSGYDITKQGGLVPDNMCQGHPTTVPTFGSGEDPCLEEAVKHITAHSTRGAV